MIKLIENRGFKWHTNNNIWVKGAFFDSNNNYYENEELLNYFKNISSNEQLLECLKKCNGIFSVIIKLDNEILCAVDRNISFPIFYASINNRWFISDNASAIIEDLNNVELNKFQIDIYRSLGHAFGHNTLIKGINQVQCGQTVQLLKNNVAKKSFYHNFSVNKFNADIKTELFEQGYHLFENSYKNLVESLNGRTAVVPLSGGFDSRLIVAGLKKQGYESVICFTYGKKENNPEIELSQKVAKELNYRWIFIEYNNELFNNFIKTDEFREYVNFSSHISSSFFLQEYFAVKHLKENNLVPENSVFIPGHSGDLIGGSQLIKVFSDSLTFNKVADTFISKKCIYKPLSKKHKRELKQLIKFEILGSLKNNGATVFEELDVREKISKVIFNSSSVFDFFNYEKRFPFWDLDLLNFFMSLPLEYRKMKYIYDNILIEKYFKPLNIHFTTELQPSKKELLFQVVKNKIKKYAPFYIKLSLLKKKDWQNYYNATVPLLHEMKENNYKFNFRGKSFNEILIEYYIYSLKTTMKKITSNYVKTY